MDFFEIKEAIIIGFILAFMIGPVFFMLIETSILKGFRAAFMLDIGVMFGDVFFLLLAYFGSKPLLSNIENNPVFFKIGGILLMTYGIYTFFKTKQSAVIQDHTIVIKEDSKYFRLFVKGFFINLINVGTLGFWLGLMLVYGAKYQMKHQTLISFFGLIILSYLATDILKILTAKKLRDKMTPATVYKMKKVIGIILVVFGAILFSRAYISDEKMQRIEKVIEKPIKKLENPLKKHRNQEFFLPN